MIAAPPCRWTADRDAELRDLWARGVTCSAIAEVLRVSRNSALGRAHRLHLPPRPSPIPSGVVRPRKTKRREQKAAATGHLKFWLPKPVKPAGACQWPSGVRGHIRFCEGPTVPGHSYCDVHFRRAYITHRSVSHEGQRGTGEA